ncbi:Binding-protein-dependent transport (system) inner membrane component, partial [Pseudomonas savastanoi pv. glycinea]
GRSASYLHDYRETRTMSLAPPAREEYEITLEPFTQEDLARDLPLAQRIWQLGWVRKCVIMIALAVIWELAARLQNNDLLLPSFLQTAAA